MHLSTCALPYPRDERRVGWIWSVNQDDAPPIEFFEDGYWRDDLGDPAATIQYTTSWELSPIGLGPPLWRTYILSIGHIGNASSKSKDLNDAIIGRIYNIDPERFTYAQIAAAYRGKPAESKTLWWPGLFWPPLILVGVVLGVMSIRRFYGVGFVTARLRAWRAGPPYPCPICSYDIGRAHSPCPECGAAIDIDDIMATVQDK